jgi:pimeloyl-ACP methyl ester carboxylesterase
VVLIHGGLWEELDARRFWDEPGISTGLAAAGFAVAAPNRPRRPESWANEARDLIDSLPERPAVIIAGSNGCSVAVRLAVEVPGLVRRLILAWPATAGDPLVDARIRDRLISFGATDRVADDLLAGSTLRGVTDAELAALTLPVAVIPSVPENPHHQRRTVDALLELLPRAEEVPGTPEPPRSDFAPYRDRLVASLITLIS